MGRRWLDQPRYLPYIERATFCHLLTRVADPPLRPGIPWPPLSGMVGVSALQRPDFAETVHYMEHCSCLRRRGKMGVLGSLLGICTWLLLIPKEDTVGNITCFHVNHLWSKECCVINACGCSNCDCRSVRDSCDSCIGYNLFVGSFMDPC